MFKCLIVGQNNSSLCSSRSYCFKVTASFRNSLFLMILFLEFSRFLHCLVIKVRLCAVSCDSSYILPRLFTSVNTFFPFSINFFNFCFSTFVTTLNTGPVHSFRGCFPAVRTIEVILQKQQQKVFPVNPGQQVTVCNHPEQLSACFRSRTYSHHKEKNPHKKDSL